jgi:hypothetical protein
VSHVRRAFFVMTFAAASLLAASLAAPTALAGQIVWARTGGASGSSIWAMNDDGTFPHQLVGAAPTLTTALPDGAIGAPDVFQLGGTTVVFTGSTAFYAPLDESAACGLLCSGTFSLSNGALTELAPAAGAASNTATFETTPRLAANGDVIFNYALYQAVSGSTLGTASETGLYERPIPPALDAPLGTLWPLTADATLAANPDLAPDPTAPSLLAWVENQDPTCSEYTLRGAPVCQFAVEIGDSLSSSAKVSIYDDESVGGTGPTSLAWSANGETLLLVDDEPPNGGIYEFAANTATAPADKTVTEVLPEPAGWTFGQARFAGSRIVFSAGGEGKSTPNTSDIYSIAANCTAASCTFPDDATDLSHDPAADNIDPAWTSARAPVVSNGAPLLPGAAPVIDAASLISAHPSTKSGVSFEVTLSVAANAKVRFTRAGKLLGTAALHLAAGATTFTVRALDRRTLSAGRDTATISAVGAASTAKQPHFTFTVKRS